MKIVHCKKAPYDVYIGRPSKWGNPFTVADWGHGVAIAKYKSYVLDKLRSGEWTEDELVNELGGKTLGCWCHPKPCHGDVLKDVVNGIIFYKRLGMSYTKQIYKT
ncbi:hypothetical protein HWB92_gp115 [Serratia phage vB_SmaA_3M]|uniref:DUF4326 domain-containing protein n=1 Tax=Serratia phage vB_SmaA_3M TaxID=2419930 RepID=A0A3G2YS81_9CAUD|nr:hypothetical protein HWB92_gp115 [Serratia phage vB_SmaA_3M]AYP28373.1 hypothetical protein 3M_117 [Serratia phage vB_SmaA_3M]